MPYPIVGTESVEVLVQKPDTMEAKERSPTCLGMFDCWSAKETIREQKDNLAHKRASRRIGMSKSARSERS